MTDSPQHYFARLLGTDADMITDFESRLARLTGKHDGFAQLVMENERRVAAALGALALDAGAHAEDVFEALMRKVKENDAAARTHLGGLDPSTTEGLKAIIALAQKISGTPTGFFLKHEIAEGLLLKNPPQRMLMALGENSVESLLKDFSLEEVFPAIRFAEDPQWLNEVFFKPFATLTPSAFEEREVKVVTLPERFKKVTDQLAGKKMHHISHLKELGVIFVMPVEEVGGAAKEGSTLEVLTLVQHYLHEVPFYSRIFRRFAEDPMQFPKLLVSALRGDVLTELPRGPSSASGQVTEERFLLIQRYLAKVDPKDQRLREPHFNPEATHWLQVEEKLEKYATEHAELGFTFWKDLGFLGSDFVFVAKEFPSRAPSTPRDSSRDKPLGASGGSATVSFDFIDSIFSHNNNRSVQDGLHYHTTEALWNALFYQYLGREFMDKLVEDNLEKGFIEIARVTGAPK